MKIRFALYHIIILLLCSSVKAQHIQSSTKKILDEFDEYQLQNRSLEASKLLDSSINITALPVDLAYLYAYQSGIYVSMDSLLLAKKLADLSMKNAQKAKSKTAMAVAYRAKAFLNNRMDMPDAVVKDALEGLKQVENTDEDLATKYHLNYLLYGAYSKWDDSDKMEHYIHKARYCAIKANNVNLQVNISNGISSMFLTRYRKDKQHALLDSSFHYLKTSYELLKQYPEKISGNTFVITCINLANHYLDFSDESLSTRQQRAFDYLDLAEEKMIRKKATSEKWGNIFGIRSSFAKKQGDLQLSEQYLLRGLSQLMNSSGNYFRLEYAINKELADLSLKRNDPRTAFSYQQRAEELLKRSFNEQQLFNAQKLEIQYETAKKDQELKLSKQREDFRRRQNYLYGGIAFTLLIGLIFMFISYHFKLRYSIEREKKLAQEKDDAELHAQMLLKLEHEEQARLKAEQELLDIRKQQLEKEALANSLIIDRKNNTLKQIQEKIQTGEASHIQKLIKEEMLLQSDFEEIKMQVQELHPDFFNRLSEKAVQKLTPLDLRYCTYIYLKMTTKQIAQVLHIEPQSVRMSKYRLKQKFGLGKEDDLEVFLGE
ncbi:helix-turn-helix transcriptional regulator [Olivibacter domesticus]|uniref:Regulatory protein, luxR family n=1 Tax=Olivibacter domesticus TaxID=407022 RepID=A0A1H7Q9T1_OLID1|nr:hypothetical protein [Olivibacter domesticus]SEL44488.1 hypothetical protein SAMN05661044_02508 [Olivibacter domesticus]